MTQRVLFVCLGNICRSPAAENIMNHLLRERGLTDRILCDSAGTGGYHVGAPPDSRMSAALKEKGYLVSGRARQFEARDFQNFDLIIAMDEENYRDILRLDPQGLHRQKVKRMTAFARRHSETEVPDPYYGGQEGFNRVIALLEDACQGLLESLDV
ncbi:MAG: low molecular weight phosphotyrosine protein phosphatase [Cyanobacteria bacterium RI_101]|nr:low molecular weight phosphotyrosine protein phosphatase [Cyanobacteria bacterium RI_101]